MVNKQIIHQIFVNEILTVNKLGADFVVLPSITYAVNSTSKLHFLVTHMYIMFVDLTT